MKIEKPFTGVEKFHIYDAIFFDIIQHVYFGKKVEIR